MVTVPLVVGLLLIMPVAAFMDAMRLCMAGRTVCAGDCLFANNKRERYNCDLSASYNIGARYFIRELLKPLPKTGRSQLIAKVPDAARRTQCALATLLLLSAELAPGLAALYRLRPHSPNKRRHRKQD